MCVEGDRFGQSVDRSTPSHCQALDSRGDFEDAFTRAQQSNTRGVRGIINLLGEEITSQEDTVAATAKYLEILETLNERQIESCISVKPTQLGLINRSVTLQRQPEQDPEQSHVAWNLCMDGYGRFGVHGGDCRRIPSIP